MNNSNLEMPESVDVSAQRIAQIYAEALLNASDKNGTTGEILGELDALVQDVFSAAPQLEAFLGSGAIGRDRKAQLLKKLFSNRASEVFDNFLQVLNNHDRLDLIRPIRVAAREIFEKRNRQVRVFVRTAVPMAADQTQRLRQELQTAFKQEPILISTVDPDLLGGMVLRVGDWLYDASVRNQLETIRNQLIEKSSHEIQSRRDRFSSAV
jgi:F-type H+-transporting ATPase subunit delta